ncbi:undecaprenyl-diphosphate phosphatase [Schlesneria paludicola]|uniref:undecaprenyl-diphosphate phosphatase n=1 Tax=Schlesneria paludicola TaxID=360056 RepID=UPI00029A1F53|nr:undecaprenyl-diphosphate phosphatase [Schlesneria paludicola]
MKISRTIVCLLLMAILLTARQVYAQTEARVESPEPARATLSPFQAVALGFVEGVTEYLPVSSTGHLLIAVHLLGMDTTQRQKDAAESLAICIQSGAILAVLVLYFGRIRQIVAGMLGRNPEGLKLLFNLLVAFFPAAVIGLLFNKWIKAHLFGVIPVAIGLFVGGVLILAQSLFGMKQNQDTGKELTQLSVRDALFVGIMQCLAFWPGFSRSLATILGCRWTGMRMMAAVEFSFLLGLVTLSAATAYEGLKHGKDMIADYGMTTPLIALFVAFVAAVVSVRFMVGALSKFGLSPFGYYRILLALACLYWL